MEARRADPADRRKRRPALKLVQGNPDAPTLLHGIRRTGPVRVIRVAASSPDLVTLAAITDDDATPIGTLTLPFCCMDMQDPAWLQGRAERVLQYSTRLELLH